MFRNKKKKNCNKEIRNIDNIRLNFITTSTQLNFET